LAFDFGFAAGAVSSSGGLPPAWNSLPGDSNTGAPVNGP
jgi:hypothetical protein